MFFLFPNNLANVIIYIMTMLLIALFTTLLCFLSSAATLRFILSRQGWFWVLPFVISLFFLYISISPLYNISTQMVLGTYQVEISGDRSVREIIPLIIIILWYTMIITFRYALKRVVPDNRHLINTEKNLVEARYLEHIEHEKYQNRLKKEAKRIIDESGTLYPFKWVTLFDEIVREKS
jgi:magnesium-transporting ATPase (P-type)